MYVVAGASGHTGAAAAETLLAHGEKVRLLVRDPAKVAHFAARGAEVVVTDLEDVEKVTAALRGARGAYLLLPPMFGATEIRKDNARRSDALFRAVEASGIPQVVLLSSIASQLDAGTGPILSTHDLEARFAGAKAAVTFLRASYFVENFAGVFPALAHGVFPTFLKSERRIPVVSSRDIGRVAAEALLQTPAPTAGTRDVIELSGPRDVSPKDVAATLTRLLGRPIAVQEGPESAIASAMKEHGLNDAWAAAYSEMTVALNAGRIAFAGAPARAVRGTIELDEALRPLLPTTGSAR